jgi:hypothetical protein
MAAAHPAPEPHGEEPPPIAAAKHYGVDPLELLRIAYVDGDGPAEEPKPKNRRKRQPPL